MGRNRPRIDLPAEKDFWRDTLCGLHTWRRQAPPDTLNELAADPSHDRHTRVCVAAWKRNRVGFRHGEAW